MNSPSLCWELNSSLLQEQCAPLNTEIFLRHPCSFFKVDIELRIFTCLYGLLWGLSYHRLKALGRRAFENLIFQKLCFRYSSWGGLKNCLRHTNPKPSVFSKFMFLKKVAFLYQVPWQISWSWPWSEKAKLCVFILSRIVELFVAR